MSDTPTARRPLVPGPPAKPTAGLTPVVDKMNSGTPPLAITPVPDSGTPPAFVVGPPRPTGKIAKAIANVMKEVGTIKKRGHNEYFHYDYARFEDLLYAITPLMGKEGLALTQSETKVETVEGNRLSILYEFVMYHESGESLPSQMHRGMCTSRSRKGDFDDKAVAKCHTGAKKQFLLGQFNVPAGDFEDPDEDAEYAQKPVPGPVNATAALAAGATVTSYGGGGGGGGPARGAISGAAESVSQQATPSGPHKLVSPPGTTADQWAEAYIRAVGTAKSTEEVTEWDKLNDEFLQRLSDRYSAVYERIATAVDRRLADIGTPLPDPKKNPQEAMNWIANQLQQMKSQEAAEAFWNTIVAPREKDFEQLDWEMLMQEWGRTEARLGAPPQDTA